MQLFYLNRALRLVGPTLICPLAFCAYNLSSIVSGLIYYDQVDQLSWLQIALVTLGTVILLAGVWIVSIKKEQEGEETVPLCAAGEYAAVCMEEPEDLEDALEEGSDEEGSVQWMPRGLTIGSTSPTLASYANWCLLTPCTFRCSRRRLARVRPPPGPPPRHPPPPPQLPPHQPHHRALPALPSPRLTRFQPLRHKRRAQRARRRGRRGGPALGAPPPARAREGADEEPVGRGVRRADEL